MKILVIIDMQNDFIDGPLGTPEAQAIVPNVVKKIKDADENTFIIFTEDTHDKNYLNTLEGKNLPVEHCMEGTRGHVLQIDVWREFLRRIEPMSKKDRDYTSRFYSVEKRGFGSMGLLSNIKSIHNDEEIEEIELVGVATDMCVISNAMLLKSAFWNIPIKVDASCCAGVTPERHEITLKAMEACQIEVVR